MFPFTTGNYIKKVRSVRPDRLVALWPQNEPLGHGISTEVIRGYNGAYTAVTLGQTGLQGTGMTSAGYDGATSYNDIYTAGLANDNLLLNPGFETAGAGDPDFWANWTETASDGALANEGVVRHEGADACKMTAGVTVDTRVNQLYVAVPGTRYRIRFWSQGDGVNAGVFHVWDATGGADIIPITTTGVTGAAYAIVEAEFAAPTDCISINVFLRCPPINGGICYYDACEVRRIDGFLGDKGTIVVPARVSGAGIWGDGLGRRLVYIGVDANNYIAISRIAANGTIEFNYKAGGVVESQQTAGLSNIDFATYGMTWDRGAGATGEVMYYIDGVASGATDVGLGTWLGDLAAANAVIGAESTVPAFEWSGSVGPVPIWSDALSANEMRYLGIP